MVSDFSLFRDSRKVKKISARVASAKNVLSIVVDDSAVFTKTLLKNVGRLEQAMDDIIELLESSEDE